MAATDPPDFLSLISTHVFSMHKWQRGLVLVSVLLFGGGSVGQMSSYFGQKNQPVIAPTANGKSIPNPPPAPEPTIQQKISPWAMRMGPSLLIGFLLGFALRVFVRITITLLVLGIGLMMLLSYFHVVNVDFSAEETKYENTLHWAEDQATRVKDSALSHLPSSGGGALGAFAGFRRRRVTS
jgi:uncharacterized membrane protein (Fun14 family)